MLKIRIINYIKNGFVWVEFPIISIEKVNFFSNARFFVKSMPYPSNWISKKTFFKQSLIIRIDVNNKYPIKSNWMRASYWRDRRLGAINVVVVAACHNKSRNETFNKKIIILSCSFQPHNISYNGNSCCIFIPFSSNLISEGSRTPAHISTQ